MCRARGQQNYGPGWPRWREVAGPKVASGLLQATEAGQRESWPPVCQVASDGSHLLPRRAELMRRR